MSAVTSGSVPLWELSEVESTILDLISRGAKNTEIADDLHYSVASVKVRVRKLMQRLGARNRAELAAKAVGFAPRVADVGEAYRIVHVGPLSPLAAAVHGAQFHVSVGSLNTRVNVRIDPLVAMAFGLHRSQGEYRTYLALMRRLKQHLKAGIDLGRSSYEVVVGTEEELRPLLEPGDCGYGDGDAGRCLAASITDVTRGNTNPDLCATCDLPPAEVRCEHLASISVAGLMASPAIQAGRMVASVSCRAGQSAVVDCVSGCLPGRRDCWILTVRA